MLALLTAMGLAAQACAATSGQPLTNDARQVSEWVIRAQDNENLPFIIVDKRQAHVWVFDRGARLQGDAPVLLGSARGDHMLPGIGDLPLSQIRPKDRTTPAGRFKADVGKNLRGETVVWVDYEGAVSMHPVLTSVPGQRREQRLATPTPADNRISYGCINVPAEFHETVVLGTVKRGPSIVYVLPETKPLRSVFTQLASAATVSERRSPAARQ